MTRQPIELLEAKAAAELADMVADFTEAQQQEALDLWAWFGSVAKTDPAWFIHYGRNMADQARRDGVG